MREIPLARGYVAIVDEEDYEMLSRYAWRLQPVYEGVGGFYAIRRGQSCGEMLMHRMIMNPPKGSHTDHINGNKLDNRRCNLRVCSAAENARNAGAQRKRSNINVSVYKGVSYYKRLSKWQSAVTFNGKQFHLGYFATEEEAAYAYNMKAKELHGEFYRGNDLDE